MIYRHLGMLILIPVMLYVAGYLYFALLFGFLIPMLVSVDINSQVKQKLFPFILGTKRDVIIKKRTAYRGGIKLIFEDDGGRSYRTPLLREFRKIQALRVIGEKASIFYVNQNSMVCMPNITELKNEYCLSRSLTKE